MKLPLKIHYTPGKQSADFAMRDSAILQDILNHEFGLKKSQSIFLSINNNDRLEICLYTSCLQ